MFEREREGGEEMNEESQHERVARNWNDSRNLELEQKREPELKGMWERNELVRWKEC